MENAKQSYLQAQGVFYYVWKRERDKEKRIGGMKGIEEEWNRHFPVSKTFAFSMLLYDETFVFQ